MNLLSYYRWTVVELVRCIARRMVAVNPQATRQDTMEGPRMWEESRRRGLPGHVQ